MRANVCGIDFDPVDQRALIGKLLQYARTGKACYVVTINLHHVLRIRYNVGLQRAVADAAALTVPDGRPLLWMGRLRGIAMHHVTGADLIIPLCHAAAREQRSVFLFGTTFETLAECGRRLSSSVEGLHIAGVYSPPFGFDEDAHECALAASVIQAAAPDFVFVALGVPKQEIWAQKYTAQLKIRAICIGAGLDFIAGVQRRAPLILRRIGLEWLWRMLTEPRRLGIRYLTILWWLPFLIARELAEAVWPRAN